MKIKQILCEISQFRKILVFTTNFFLYCLAVPHNFSPPGGGKVISKIRGNFGLNLLPSDIGLHSTFCSEFYGTMLTIYFHRCLVCSGKQANSPAVWNINDTISVSYCNYWVKFKILLLSVSIFFTVFSDDHENIIKF